MKTIWLKVLFTLPEGAIEKDDGRVEAVIATLVRARGGEMTGGGYEGVFVPCEDPDCEKVDCVTVQGRSVDAEFVSESDRMADSPAIAAAGDLTLLENVISLDCFDVVEDGDIQGSISWSRFGEDGLPAVAGLEEAALKQ